MATLFASGRIVDLLFVFIALEVIALEVVRRRWRRGIPGLDLIISLSAGMALLLALRAALQAAPWQQVAAYLGLSLLAHGVDLARRWTTE